VLFALCNSSYLSEQYDLFKRSEGAISRVRTQVSDHIVLHWRHLLKSPLHMNVGQLQQYCEVMEDCGSPFPNTWGFLVPLFQTVLKPLRDGKSYLNEATNTYGLKYLAAFSLDGMIQVMHGPHEGSYSAHDIYCGSNLRDELMQLSAMHFPLTQFMLCGDNSFESDEVLITPVPNGTYNIQPFLAGYHNATQPGLTQAQDEDLTQIRQVLDWAIYKIERLFPAVMSKKYAGPLKEHGGKLFSVAAIIANCHTCMNGAGDPAFAMCAPPSLESYLVPAPLVPPPTFHHHHDDLQNVV
jgi:hypothetical protein